jgi:hypothetical protein
MCGKYPSKQPMMTPMDFPIVFDILTDRSNSCPGDSLGSGKPSSKALARGDQRDAMRATDSIG